MSLQCVSDARDKPLRNVGFVHQRPIFDSVRRDQVHAIAVAAHDSRSRADVIGDNPVAAFAAAFRLAELDDILGLGRKAYDQARASRRMRDGGENVGILGEP
jgi:hypothetical protein